MMNSETRKPDLYAVFFIFPFMVGDNALSGKPVRETRALRKISRWM
jgi:hypothetical protein